MRITPLVGWGLDMHNNPSLSLGGRVVYSPARAFGVELFGARLRPGTPDEALFDPQPEEPQTASRTQMLSVGGASVRWRPIYGALGSHWAVIGRFRVDLGVGAGLAVTRAECINGLAIDPHRGFPTVEGETICNGDQSQSAEGPTPRFYEPNTLRPVAILSSGVEVDIMTNVAVRFEVRDILFVARIYRPDDDPALDDAVVHRVFLQAGASLVF